MNDDKKKMTQEEAEEDFKKKMFDIFSEKIPGGVYRDEDGFIVIQRRQKRENKDNDS